MKAGSNGRKNYPRRKCLNRLKSRLEFTPPQKKTKVRSFWPYAAAACVLLTIGISLVWTQRNRQNNPEKIAQAMPKDIAPGANRAALTLSDGKTISLDSSKNGNLTSQGNVSITKQDSGLLSYQIINPSLLPEKEDYNILTVPPGGQFRVQLPDGTKVWLNAASTLKYPTIFHGSKRKVELTGEGYFEVTKDPMFPFEVTAAGVSVLVLGTHFNINAYSNEPELKVTLAEGSVQVNESVTLKPGQQALVNQKAEIKMVAADLDAELAWKNGTFLFKETPLEVVMRQVARWYNTEISYDENISEHFNADIPRSVPVSKLLHLLEATGRVHFKIEDKKIIVMK